MKLHCAREIPLSAGAFCDALHSPRYEALVAATIDAYAKGAAAAARL